MPSDTAKITEPEIQLLLYDKRPDRVHDAGIYPQRVGSGAFERQEGRVHRQANPDRRVVPKPREQARARGCHQHVRSATAKLDEMRPMGRIPKGGLEIAIDMHDISRYDKKHDDELVRAKPKNGTSLSGAYMTIQCMTRGRCLILAVLPVCSLQMAA